MKAFVVELGPCEPWVTAEWDDAGSMFSVRCQHCGGIDFAYTPFLRREPAAPGVWVELHNRCRSRAEVAP